MSNWYVGQLVKCVRSTSRVKPDVRHPLYASFEDYNYPQPMNGSFYRIRKIFPALDNAVTFWLEELDDDYVAYHEEMFQPVNKEDVEKIGKHSIPIILE